MSKDNVDNLSGIFDAIANFIQQLFNIILNFMEGLLGLDLGDDD